MFGENMIPQFLDAFDDMVVVHSLAPRIDPAPCDQQDCWDESILESQLNQLGGCQSSQVGISISVGMGMGHCALELVCAVFAGSLLEGNLEHEHKLG